MSTVRKALTPITWRMYEPGGKYMKLYYRMNINMKTFKGYINYGCLATLGDFLGDLE